MLAYAQKTKIYYQLYWTTTSTIPQDAIQLRPNSDIRFASDVQEDLQSQAFWDDTAEQYLQNGELYFKIFRDDYEDIPTKAKRLKNTYLIQDTAFLEHALQEKIVGTLNWAWDLAPKSLQSVATSIVDNISLWVNNTFPLPHSEFIEESFPEDQDFEPISFLDLISTTTPVENLKKENELSFTEQFIDIVSHFFNFVSNHPFEIIVLVLASQAVLVNAQKPLPLKNANRQPSGSTPLTSEIQQIPDQVIDANTLWNFPINGTKIFGREMKMIGVMQQNSDSWLQFQPTYHSLGLPPTQFLYVDNNIGYATSEKTLSIFNLSDTNHLISTYPLLSQSEGLTVDNHIAYICEGEEGSPFKGIQILNVTDLHNIKLLSNYPTYYPAISVVVQNNHAFLANYRDGLQVINVQNPYHPFFVNSYYSPHWMWVGEVILSGNTLFLGGNTDQNAGFDILNIQNPTYPTFIAKYSTVREPYSMGMALGNYLFISEISAFQIFNITVHAAPTLFASYTFPKGNLVNSISTYDKQIFTAGTQAQWLDLTQGKLLGTPTLANLGKVYQLVITGVDKTGRSLAVTFKIIVDQVPQPIINTLADQSLFPQTEWSITFNHKSFFTNPSQSFTQLSATTENNQPRPHWIKLSMVPRLLGNYFNPSISSFSAENIATVGNTAFLMIDYIGLQSINIADPVHPTLLGQHAINALVKGKIVNNNAYIVCSSSNEGVSEELQIVDLSNPGLFFLLSNYPTKGSPVDVAIAGNFAYLAESKKGVFNGVEIVNIANPLSPLFAGSHKFNGSATSLTVVDNILYATESNIGGSGSNQLHVFDITFPSFPVLLGSYSTLASPKNIYVTRRAAFIAEQNGVLEIIDVSNPGNLTLLTSYTELNQNAAQRILVQNNTLFLAGGNNGLQIFDVTNLSNPIPLTSSDQSSFSYVADVTFEGNTLFVAEGISGGGRSTGFQIFDLSQWKFSGTPQTSDGGNYKITLTAQDERGATASQQFKIRVESAPQVNGIIPFQYAKVGQPFNYFVPQGLFFDANFDPLTFNLKVLGQSSLPHWMLFNSAAGILSGTPQEQDRGDFTLVLSATDNIAGSASVSFGLSVTQFPQVTRPLSQVINADVNMPYSFSLPKDIFYDPNGFKLIYNATLLNNIVLPAWLNFNPETLTFMGMPGKKDVGQLVVTVTASEEYASPSAASISFALVVYPNYAPRIENLISDLIATVSEPFNFIVPVNTFTDPNNNPLSYSAQEVINLITGKLGPLPSWLNFDAISRTFSGTPTCFDTNLLPPRTLRIALTTSDGELDKTLFFNINVAGTSCGALTLTVLGSIISSIGAIGTIYKLIVRILQKEISDEKTAIVGEEFNYKLVSKEKNITVQAVVTIEKNTWLDHAQFWKKYRPIPGGALLPYWLGYDGGRNCLYSKENGPRETDKGLLFIQIKNEAGALLEEIKLNVGPVVEAPQNQRPRHLWNGDSQRFASVKTWFNRHSFFNTELQELPLEPTKEGIPLLNTSEDKIENRKRCILL